jgi:hypothetical protein
MSFLVNPYLYAPSCGDADAVAFLAAAGITDATITSAICTLVTSMKANGTWTKCNAIYPMVGGTATTHKFNLKNPLDTNAAFRLSFVGGWTHSSNGALPNGTNAYANTFLNPLITLNFASNSFGIYSRTNNVTGSRVYGAFQGSLLLHNNLTAGNFVSGSVASLISYTANPSTSLLIGTRTTSTLFTAYRAGVLLGTNTALVSTLPNLSFYFGARNGNNIAEFFTNHQFAFAFLGSGLNSTEAASMYTDVQAFQTTLSRQV